MGIDHVLYHKPRAMFAAVFPVEKPGCFCIEKALCFLESEEMVNIYSVVCDA